MTAYPILIIPSFVKFGTLDPKTQVKGARRPLHTYFHTFILTFILTDDPNGIFTKFYNKYILKNNKDNTELKFRHEK